MARFILGDYFFQARNLLLQSGLPQNVLAQIWGLSDVDSDGKLSTEEFILAGHLCDLALKGEPLPAVGSLPSALVPPSLRKGKINFKLDRNMAF